MLDALGVALGDGFGDAERAEEADDDVVADGGFGGEFLASGGEKDHFQVRVRARTKFITAGQEFSQP